VPVYHLAKNIRVSEKFQIRSEKRLDEFVGDETYA
jgi:hypothetical protein